jgi:predicted TPR repeat methyltransferase
MAAAAAAVRPCGQFVFSVERGEEDDGTMAAGFRINPLGRYSHQESYVRRVISEAGMELKSIAHGALRQEMGSPVAGLVVTAVIEGVKV